MSIHETAKEDIMNLIGKNSETIFSEEFKILFNGIKIKNIPDKIIVEVEEVKTEDENKASKENQPD